MDNRPIAVFDSGVGGLTVFKELQKLLPNESFIYFGDTARVPYGNKSAETVKGYALEIAEFLEMQNIKMLVIACNTASAYALNTLKAAFSMPVIGVIDPGVRAAVKATKSGTIAVIGTKGTISSDVYQKKIEHLRADLKVFGKPCPLLVPIIEENLTHSKLAKDAIEMYLDDFRNASIQTLILACTHYPLIAKHINDFFKGKVKLVDSAEETAKETQELLIARRIEASENNRPTERFFVTDAPESFAEIAKPFLGRTIEAQAILHK
ncbi:MAG: glutamate racemase [Candidatus Riflebacteria bacterium]|nr:glutamate racemase [Candidatus Riflebacteria bacterium]